MDESENIEEHKSVEVMQLDDSFVARKSIPDSSSIKRNIVMRLKSGECRSSIKVTSVCKPDEDTSKPIKSCNSIDSIEIEGTNRRDNSDKQVEEDNFGIDITGHKLESETPEISLDSNDYSLDVFSDSVISDKIVKRDDAKCIINSVNTYRDSSNESINSDSVKPNKCANLSEFNDKLNVTNENLLAHDYSVDNASAVELSDSVGENICNLQRNSDNMSLRTNNLNTKTCHSPSKTIDSVKSIKRCEDELSNKSVKMSKRFTSHTDSTGITDKQEHVPPLKEFTHSVDQENDTTVKLIDNETDDGNSLLLCEDESWGIVIDSTDSDLEQTDDFPEDEFGGIIIDSTNSDTEQMENEDQHSESSSDKHISLSTDKDPPQNKNSKSKPSCSSFDTDCYFDEIVPIKHNRYYCKICKLHISNISDVQTHAARRSHIRRKDKGNGKTKSESSGRPKSDSKFEPISRRLEINNNKRRKIPSSALHNDGIEILRDTFYCRVCDCMISKSRKNLIQHKHGRSHKLAFQQYKKWILSCSTPNISSHKPSFYLKDSKTDHSSSDRKSQFEQRRYTEKIEKSSRRQPYHCTVRDFITTDFKNPTGHMLGRRKETICIKKEIEMDALHEGYYRRSEKKRISFETDIGYCERVDKLGRRLYYCTVCNYRAKQRSILKDHMQGKRHKEALHIMKERNSQHEEYYMSSSDLSYGEESIQSREDLSLNSDYQSDILWNQCYENFMRFTLNQEDFLHTSTVTDLPNNTDVFSPANQHTVSINDSSFQPLVQDFPQEGIQDFQQTSVAILQQQQVQTSLYPHTEQVPVPYASPFHQTQITSFASPQQNVLPTSMLLPLNQENQVAEQNQANDASRDYLQSCVTNEGDAEIVIDIIHSLLHTYLKYKLKGLPGSLLKLLHSSSKSEANKAISSKSMNQLLTELQKHKSKFRKTFTPVTNDTKLSSYDQYLCGDEEIVAAASNVMFGQNENSVLRSIKKNETSINDLFEQYRNSNSEKKSVESDIQEEPTTDEFSEHYGTSLNTDDDSPRNSKLMDPLLMTNIYQRDRQQTRQVSNNCE